VSEAGEPNLTVIIPCYNEREGIGPTIADLHRALGEVGEYELIAVDDGSTDGSREVLHAMAREDRRLRVIEHRSNRGYGAAVKTGLRDARSQRVATIDADGTYPADALPRLLRAGAEADMVVGAREFDGVREPFLRTLARSMLRRYASFLARRAIPDVNSGLRVFRRVAILPLLQVLPDGFSFCTTSTLAMLTNGCEVAYVPIRYKPRLGRSKIRPVRDALRFFYLATRTAIAGRTATWARAASCRRPARPL